MKKNHRFFKILKGTQFRVILDSVVQGGVKGGETVRLEALKTLITEKA